MYKYLIILLLSVSCNTPNAKINTCTVCLDTYSVCDAECNEIENDHLSKAKWLHRQMKYDSTDIHLNLYITHNTVEDFNNYYYQEYILQKLLNNRRIGVSNKDIINKLKGKILDKTSVFYVRLLIEEGLYYRKMHQENREKSAIHYANQILSNIDDKHDKLKFLLDYSLAHSYLSSQDSLLTQHYLDRVFLYCKNNIEPLCKYAYSIGKYEKHHKTKNVKLKEIDTMYSNYYIPEIDRLTSINHSFISKDSIQALQYARSALLSLEQNCTTNLYSALFEIESLINLKEFELAQSKIDTLTNICSEINDIPFQVYGKQSRLSEIKYELTNNFNELIRAIRNNREATNAARNLMSNEENMHFADFNYNNINDLIRLYNKIETNHLSEELLNTVFDATVKYRIFNKDLAYETTVLAKTNLSEPNLKKYLNTKEKIESLEESINNYQDTSYQQTDVFQKIYDAYGQLDIITNVIHELPVIVQQDSFDLITMQELLSSQNAQIIEYLTGDTIDYCIHITPSKYNISEIGKKESIEYIESIKDRILELNHNNSALLPKLDTSLSNIIILHDAEISEIPFEALYHNHSMLLNDFNISYNLTHSKNISLTSDQEIALFSYSGDNSNITGGRIEYSELPIGNKEIKSIAKLYDKNQISNGTETNKETILSSLSSNILHISTHSFSNPENLLGNYLIVRNQNGDPEKLYGYQIKNSVCTSDLVILSSCNSGTGAYKPGAGTFSLSRDFLAAGAKAVIKSLWNVNEASTAELMISFHTYFQDHSVSEALTLAKRDLANSEKYSHPYYWAGFVLEGNPNIYLDKD